MPERGQGPLCAFQARVPGRSVSGSNALGSTHHPLVPLATPPCSCLPHHFPPQITQIPRTEPQGLRPELGCLGVEWAESPRQVDKWGEGRGADGEMEKVRWHLQGREGGHDIQSLPAEKVPRPGLRLAICFTCSETASIGDPWGPLWLHRLSQRREGGLRPPYGPWTRRHPCQFSHLLWKPLCSQRQTSPDLCLPFPASPSLSQDCFEGPRVCGPDWQGLRAQQTDSLRGQGGVGALHRLPGVLARELRGRDHS